MAAHETCHFDSIEIAEQMAWTLKKDCRDSLGVIQTETLFNTLVVRLDDGSAYQMTVKKIG